MTFLTAENLTVARENRIIARELDFSIPAGAFLIVAGPNGAGKSTLLRVLSGELPAREGRVFLGERNIRTFSQQELARKRVFLAQQSECRLPFLAREMVLLGAEAAGHRGGKARARADDAMTLAGVSHLADRIMSRLSGGEQQRIHWARTLAQLDNRPEGRAVFLDEPVSSLDLAHQHELLALSLSLARAGATVIAVLHDLNLAARYADHMLLMHQGRMYSYGPPVQVLSPETLSQVFSVRTKILTHPGDTAPVIFVEDVLPSGPSSAG